MNCSSVERVHNEFDNSIYFKLVQDENEFYRMYGNILLSSIKFSKEFKDGKMSVPRLFCKFEGRNGEYVEGNTIELNIDGAIYKLTLDESRLAQYEKISSSSYTLFTRLGAFTFSDASKENIHILAMETYLTPDIVGALLKSKSIMVRVYTKNIDGVAQNIFHDTRAAVDDIKEFINAAPKE
jgi:hypothetical protein